MVKTVMAPRPSDSYSQALLFCTHSSILDFDHRQLLQEECLTIRKLNILKGFLKKKKGGRDYFAKRTKKNLTTIYSQLHKRHTAIGITLSTYISA